MASGEWAVGEAEAGIRLDKYLAGPQRLGSRAKAAAAIERGKVFVNGVEADLGAAARTLATGDRVRVWMDRPGSAKARARVRRVDEITILYEDDSLLVVDKPPGL